MDNVPEWFAKLMVMAAEACPSTRLSEGMVRSYWFMLRDLTTEAITAAVVAAIKESNGFIPGVGVIRAHAVGRPEDVGLLAWSGLTQAASTVGAYGALLCDDCAVGRAVERVFGSWGAFCEQCVDVTTPAWGAKRSEFLAAYRDERRHRLPGALPHRLVGLLGTPEQGTWAGRLTLSGEVQHERALPQLPGGAAQRQLGAAFDEPLTD